MLTPSLIALTLAQAEYRGCRLISFRGLDGLTLAKEEGAKKTYSVTVSPEIQWDEMVPSWNVDLPDGATVTFRARARTLDKETKAYNLGTWSLKGVRQSEKDQKDEDGNVYTDTLVVKSPGAKLEFLIEIDAPPGTEAKVKLLTLSFRDSKAKLEPLPPNKSAWGKVIEAPRRSQISYPNGNVLCSPTSVSMILAHWSKEMKRPELDKDVPEVEKGVYDPNWPGTGNWPFNTAFAGCLPGITAYVSRFTDIRELEDWTAAGFPIACSVSSMMIKGKPKGKDDGHLVVLVGFTKDGDPVFNDPGRSVEIRQVYKREDFDKAWATSGRTVYLIYPEGRKTPKDGFGHWVP
jgi:hypothetical protein